MTFNTFKFAAVAAALALSAPAFASLTYATGQDLDHDDLDDQFTVNSAQAYLVTAAAPGWPVLPQPSVTSGRYISWDPIQSGRPSTVFRNNVYNYSFQFNWAGSMLQGNADTTTFDFRWISDDYLTDVTLNGTSLGVNNIGASKVWRISNSASVVGELLQGLNTINFLVNNTGGGANGLAADFTIHGNAVAVPSSDVPEPAPLALMGLGLAIALAVSRKRA
ncbi:PEP-CTERM sorting domain-containing protein [Massilia sp. TSP1-1-2]|uniref:PEP-CTERM sorting domain-containing protein n=1 Tax=Massilia sp. TSP1-1-2 TaxID=2804649 RepID=UPI003CF58AD4